MEKLGAAVMRLKLTNPSASALLVASRPCSSLASLLVAWSPPGTCASHLVQTDFFLRRQTDFFLRGRMIFQTYLPASTCLELTCVLPNN